MKWIATLICTLIAFSATAQDAQPLAAMNLPQVALDGVPFTVKTAAPQTALLLQCQVGEKTYLAKTSGGQLECEITLSHRGKHEIKALMGDDTLIAQGTVSVISGWWSIMPALLAIIMALAIRQVLPALFLGVWVGAWLLAGGGFSGVGAGLLAVLDTYILEALVPKDGSGDHMSIILFTLLTGAMIGVITKNGGMGGVVKLITRFANTPKKGQLATSTIGLSIFFDDYANTLIVGNTMRPILDKLRVSREKLAYLVDSTSAPLAATALITTWIGFQVSLLKDTLPGLEGVNMSAYEFMLSIIPYSFYSLLALAFVFMVVLTGRDFGPMLEAEKKARAHKPAKTKKADKNADDQVIEHAVEEGNPWNAVVPIATLVLTTIWGLYHTGSGDTMADIFGSANSFEAMMWASLLSLVVAVAMSVATRSLTLEQSMEALEQGLVPMMAAAIILTFAWAIASVNEHLHTADFVISILGGELSPQWIPALVFIVAAITAFATGASWGTMAILIPLALPLTWTAMQDAGMTEPEHLPILFTASASVLAGAVWGDHCSPISDTTVLSSLASRCEHIAHVRTQMPYALTVGAAALAFAIVPVSFGLPWWLGLLLAGGALYFVLQKFGKTAE